MNKVVDTGLSAWDPRFLLLFLWAPLIIFQGLTASLIS